MICLSLISPPIKNKVCIRKSILNTEADNRVPFNSFKMWWISYTLWQRGKTSVGELITLLMQCIVEARSLWRWRYCVYKTLKRQSQRIMLTLNFAGRTIRAFELNGFTSDHLNTEFVKLSNILVIKNLIYSVWYYNFIKLTHTFEKSILHWQWK